MKQPRIRGSVARIAIYGGILASVLVASFYLITLDSSAAEQEMSSATRISEHNLSTQVAIKKIEAKRTAEAKARADAAKKVAEATIKGGSIPPSKAAQACNSSKSHNNPHSIDVLVNKKHCLQPIDFVPPDLVVVYGATLRSEAARQYRNMADAATAAGSPFNASSSYRSYTQQVTTYNHWVSVNGSVAAADTVSARPGYSEHQTGLTVDVASGSCSLECFETSAAYKWVRSHAHEYGFILRYPNGKSAITGYSPEPWHYRYVGTSVAKDMKAKNITTLEEYWGMPGGSY